MKKKLWFVIIPLLLVIIILVLYFAGRSLIEDPHQMIFASIWDDKYDINDASPRVQKARSGFIQGVEQTGDNLDLLEVLISEGPDVGKFTTSIAEIYNNTDILMTVGATTDEATMYASTYMNFFDIPILIPFGDGDLSSTEEETDYSIRMTPVSQNYVDFINKIYSKNIFDYINTYLFENKAVPRISADVAVFFADNFNGHESTVKMTQQIMDNGFTVKAYQPFEKDMLLPRVQAAWSKNPEAMSDLESVLIVGEDLDSLPSLVDVWHLWADRGLYPVFILIGYAPNQVEPELASASNVFVIQQALDLYNCPSEIVNRSEAMGYAAGTVLTKALKKACDTMLSNNRSVLLGISRLFMNADQRKSVHQDYLKTYRMNIRTALLDMEEEIPCYGFVNFNSDVGNWVELELVHYTDVDQFTRVDTSVIFNRIISDVREKYGITDR